MIIRKGQAERFSYSPINGGNMRTIVAFALIFIASIAGVTLKPIEGIALILVILGAMGLDIADILYGDH